MSSHNPALSPGPGLELIQYLSDEEVALRWEEGNAETGRVQAWEPLAFPRLQ